MKRHVPLMRARQRMKKKFEAFLDAAETVCILGHINPDGDCVGSTLSLYNYIKKRNPEKKVTVFLDGPSEKFTYLNGFKNVITECAIDKSHDLAIVCDCGDTKRLGKFVKYLETAKTSFLVDHHATNQGFCDEYFIEPKASSTSEMTFLLMDEELFDKNIAECIYTGIIHDTGVFKYNTTSKRTMEIAARCMEMGISFGKIIDESFYYMTVAQRKLLGHVLTGLTVALSGKFVYATLDRKTMLSYGIETSRDTDGFIDNIRETEGALGAAFFYQIPDGTYKGSLRSNSKLLDVSKIAVNHGGGGHIMAAGCFLSRNVEEDIEKIIEEVREQIES